MRFRLASALILACLVSPAAAQTGLVSGVGDTPITRDSNTVRALAETNARKAVVETMIRQTLGAERMSEVSPEVITRLAGQIRDDMIVSRSSEKVGNLYRTRVDARIDQSWFQSKLDDEGIQSSSSRAGGETQPIFVMLDEQTGPARDSQRPSEVVTEYDRRSGAAYSDTSRSALVEKDRQASSYKAGSAMSASSASAGGYDDGYEAGGYASRDRAAAASSVQARDSSSHTLAAVDQTNVQAASHDDVRFRQRVTYQVHVSTGPSEIARTALGSSLRRYGVDMTASEVELASQFNGRPPIYASLRTSAQFKPFLAGLAQRNIAPFFMGGTIKLQDIGRDTATGYPMCSGSLAASAYATGNSYMIAEGTSTGSGTGVSYEDCAAKLSKSLAEQAAAELGPQVQNYWRSKMRGQARIVAASTAVNTEYTLTIRSNHMDMATQADVMDALSSTPGVERQVFLGQSGNQISFQVRYSSDTPLQMALYRKLRGNPAFAQMQPTTQGQSVVLCLNGC